jgi:serine/threonine protein kinase
MGEVFFARGPGAKGLGKFVALKKIRPDYIRDENMKQLFRREAEVAIQLSHPNIAAIYEVGEDQDSLFLVLEYVAGVTLRQIFEARAEGDLNLDLANVLQVVISLLSGLSYAHRFVDPVTQKNCPVIHCDVCMQNVLVSFEGDIKLIDFGIAKVEGRDGQSGPIMGKIDYISPEHLMGQPLDGRADIFAVGIIMWELLTGRRYYEGESEREIRHRITIGQSPKKLPANIQFAKQLQVYLDRMIASDLNDRYGSAEDVAADLRLFFGRMFPRYIPSQFRNVLEGAFSQEAKLQRQMIAKFSQVIPDQIDPEDPIPSNSKVAPPVVDRDILNKSTIAPIRIVHEFGYGRILKNHFFTVALVLAMGFFLSELLPPKFFDSIVKRFVQPRVPANIVSQSVIHDITENYSGKKVTLFVDTIPSGAQVIVDGRKIYRRTPINLLVLPGQSYVLGFEKSGFAVHEEQVNSLIGSLRVELIPVARHGSIPDER